MFGFIQPTIDTIGLFLISNFFDLLFVKSQGFFDALCISVSYTLFTCLFTCFLRGRSLCHPFHRRCPRIAEFRIHLEFITAGKPLSCRGRLRHHLDLTASFPKQDRQTQVLPPITGRGTGRNTLGRGRSADTMKRGPTGTRQKGHGSRGQAETPLEHPTRKGKQSRGGGNRRGD